MLGVQTRAAALLASTHQANARRLVEAQARAARILAEAEATNARDLELAQAQADKMLPPARLPNLPQSLAPAQPEPSSAANMDGGVDLIAGPFARFSELAAFTRAVREIQGVVTLDTRQFFKGTVHLRLRYEDPLPLAVRLAELTEFAPSITSASSTRVELGVLPAARTPTEEVNAEPLGRAA